MKKYWLWKKYLLWFFYPRHRHSIFIILCTITLLPSCGFHLQGELKLAPPLKRLYLQTSDPYGNLAHNLIASLKMSRVQLVSSPAEASTILVILRDETAQDLLSTSGTQQTRQYNLSVIVTFDITDVAGRSLAGPQTLSETRTITIQSNQVLGSSNEVNSFYEQMRRSLAYGIMNRIASKEITKAIIGAFPKT
jgi:outer membrane lipopolysaccharide assembly protein LptE/RlpB